MQAKVTYAELLNLGYGISEVIKDICPSGCRPGCCLAEAAACPDPGAPAEGYGQVRRTFGIIFSLIRFFFLPGNEKERLTAK